MSNVTLINPAAAKDHAEAKLDAVIKDLLFDVEAGCVAVNVATDALEKIEDELAVVDQPGDDPERHQLYATLYLIREKLRNSAEEIERACDRARAVIYPDATGEAPRA